MNGPSRREDARSITAIVGAGLVGIVATSVFAARAADAPREPARHDVIRVRVEARPTTIRHEKVIPSEARAYTSSDRLWGHVETRAGEVHTGLIRWDRNEGSWADVLDATKGDRTAGIRFGHIRLIEPTGPESARITLRSGGVVNLSDDKTDLGSQLRALVVEGPGAGSVRLDWNDLARVEFEAAPADLEPVDGRLHGTLSTRSGLEFTGYVAWNVADIYTSDHLDARDRSGVRDIPFGSVASIHRSGGIGAVVLLTDGSRLLLRGGEDIGGSNGGITVSDPGLGEVKVSWSELASVRFHPPPSAAGLERFDGGGPIEGTVTTEDGTSRSGILVWDHDEAAAWEMLNGSDGGVEFQVEFANIARVVKSGTGVLVELRDGRTLHLASSNDVTAANRGILVGGNGAIDDVSWSEFSELRLGPGAP